MKEYEYGSIVLFKSDCQIGLGRITGNAVKGMDSYYQVAIYNPDCQNYYEIILVELSGIIDFAPNGIYNGIFIDETGNTVIRACVIFSGHIQYVYENNKKVFYHNSNLVFETLFSRNNLNLHNKYIELEEELFL